MSRLIITSILLNYLLTSEAKQSITQQPNIVIIYADDLAWADVGYNGNILG